MMTIPENWPFIVATGLRKVFLDVYKEQPANVPTLFNMQPSQKSQEFDLSDEQNSVWTALNDDINFRSDIEGYRTTYTHAEFSDGKKIKRRLLMDDLYGVLQRKPAQMAMGARTKRETDGASVFNNSFSSGFTGGDSLSLCNSAHTFRNSASTFSNTGVLSLTPANVEATRKNMVKLKHADGTPKGLMPDMLVYGIDQEQTGWEIINTSGQVNTALNNSNFHKGRYKALVWPNYVASTTQWWMLDSRMMKLFLLWFDREPIQFFKDRDFGVLAAGYAGYMVYSYGWSDPSFVFGQNP